MSISVSDYPAPRAVAPINVPFPTKSSPPVMGAAKGGMMELIDEVASPKTKGVEAAKGFDKGTIAALGISERKLFTGKTKPLPQDADTPRRFVRNGPLGVLQTHKLLLGTGAASIGFFLLLMHFNYLPLSLIACCVGFGITAGAWRSQLLENSDRKVAGDWKVIQQWLGTGLLLLIACAGTWTCGYKLYWLFSEYVPVKGMNNPAWTFLGIYLGIWLLIVGYCVVMWIRSSKFGFFKAAAWSYILLFLGIWTAAAAGQLGPKNAHASASPNPSDAVIHVIFA